MTKFCFAISLLPITEGAVKVSNPLKKLISALEAALPSIQKRGTRLHFV